MPYPIDDPARDVYIGLLKKAQRMYVAGVGNVLFFKEGEFPSAVLAACSRIVIHLPPPEIVVEKPKSKGGHHQPPAPNCTNEKRDVVSALINLGYGKRQSEMAAEQAEGNTIEELLRSALQRVAVM